MGKDASTLMNAIKNAATSGVKIEKTEDPTPPKKSKGMNIAVPPMYFKPTIYLDDKDLSSIKDWKAGSKVYLAIECTVRSVSSNENMDDKGTKTRHTADIQIDSFADLGSKNNG